MKRLPKLVRHHYSKKFPSGLGDYMRSALVANKCFNMGGDTHSLYFEGGNLENCFNVYPVFDKTKYEKEVFITTNSYEPISQIRITTEDKKNFKQLIEDTVKPEILKRVEEDFERNPHDVAIHVRCGDQTSSINNPYVRIENIDKAYDSVMNLMKIFPEDFDIRLFTDNITLKEKVRLSGNRILVNDIIPHHTAYDETDHTNDVYEFLMMMKSKLIYSFISTNGKQHISSFSFFCSYLCDIPIFVVFQKNFGDGVFKDVIKEASPYSLFSETYFLRNPQDAFN